jgi:negative regulator of sigma E activity
MTTSNSMNDRQALLESLSALFDGELSTSESAFLIKRMQHDQELLAAWERMQLTRDALREQNGEAASQSFASRVMQQIAAEQIDPVVATTTAESMVQAPSSVRELIVRNWRRYAAGGAIAAGVAWMALTTGIGIAPTASDPSVVIASSPQAPNPMTAASPLVGMHQVSDRIGSGSPQWVPVRGNLDQRVLEASLDEFLMLHATANPAVPLTPVPYIEAIVPASSSAQQ